MLRALNQIVFDPCSSHWTTVIYYLQHYDNKSKIYPAGLVKASFLKKIQKAVTCDQWTVIDCRWAIEEFTVVYYLAKDGNPNNLA